MSTVASGLLIQTKGIISLNLANCAWCVATSKQFPSPQVACKFVGASLESLKDICKDDCGRELSQVPPGDDSYLTKRKRTIGNTLVKVFALVIKKITAQCS